MNSRRRNIILLKNIKWSGLFRVMSIGLNLMLIPFLLEFLGKTHYGIWLTISSFLGWSTLLDLGIGNGLKNRLAEAVAKGRNSEIRLLSSSAYFILVLIATVACAILISITSLLDWGLVLNTDDISSARLSIIIGVFFIFFCLKLVLNQVMNIAASQQFTALSDGLNFSVNLLILIAVSWLGTADSDGLMTIVMLFGGVPVVLLIIISIWAFRGPYKPFRPSIKYFNWSKALDVMNLGGSFFIIQIAGIVIFSTDNLIISYSLAPSEVPAYQVSFRYFGVIVTFFSILCTPIWPAFTHAYNSGDISWIGRTTRRLIRIWGLTMIGVAVMLIASPFVYEVWLDDKLYIPFRLSLIMACYVALLTWGTIFVTFINSVGALRVQLICSVIAGLLNVPMSMLIIEHTDLGATGVMLATIICLSYGPIISVIHYKKLINGTAKGIWLK